MTALYGIVLTRDAYTSAVPFASVRLQWEGAESGDIEEIEGDVHGSLLAASFEETPAGFQLAASVAAYAEVLRDSRWISGYDLDEILDEIERLPWRELDDDADELLDLVAAAARLDR